MPVPSNITAATAIVISTLPYTNTQQVDDAGVTYDVWYLYTATFDGVIGVWGFGDLVVYKPNTFVGSPDDLTTYLGFLLNPNKPILFPVVTGVDYYLSFHLTSGNPSPANLAVSVLAAPVNAGEVGDFLVNNDLDTDPLFWTTILDKDNDNTVKRYVEGIVPGEQGNILENGKFLLSDDNNDDAVLYDSQFNELLTLTFTTDAALIIGISKVLQRFYVCYSVPASTDWAMNEYDLDGVSTGRSWTLTGVLSVSCIAINSDATILYFSRGGESAILRWDLDTDLALSDLVADTATYDMKDLFYLEDDTIIGLLLKSSPVDVEVRQYNSTTGAVITTKNFGSDSQASGAPPRLAFSLTSPTDYWIWIKRATTTQTSKFFNVRLSDGVVLVDRTHVIYQEGIYSGTATATPEGRFGSSLSCPFLLLRASATPRVSGSGLYVLTVSSGGGTPGGIVPTKTDDSYIDNLGVEQTVAIPNPFIETYLAPDENDG